MVQDRGIVTIADQQKKCICSIERHHSIVNDLEQPHTGCRFSVPVTCWTLDQRSYFTLGLVSAWMGDHLWTDKPPRRRTRHPGLLSLSPPSVIGSNEYTRRKLASKRAHRVIHQPVSVVFQCGKGKGKGLDTGHLL